MVARLTRLGLHRAGSEVLQGRGTVWGQSESAAADQFLDTYQRSRLDAVVSQSLIRSMCGRREQAGLGVCG